MKIKVWVTLDVERWPDENEINIANVQVFAAKEAAERESRWYVSEAELELGTNMAITLQL